MTQLVKIRNVQIQYKFNNYYITALYFLLKTLDL